MTWGKNGKKKKNKNENVEKKESVPNEINTSDYYGCKVSSLLVGKSCFPYESISMV